MGDYDTFALQDEFGDDLDDIATEIAVLRRENARLRADADDTDAYERGRRFERARIANLIRATAGSVRFADRGVYERLLIDIETGDSE